jgi:hypothetical protein
MRELPNSPDRVTSRDDVAPDLSQEQQLAIAHAAIVKTIQATTQAALQAGKDQRQEFARLLAERIARTQVNLTADAPAASPGQTTGDQTK